MNEYFKEVTAEAADALEFKKIVEEVAAGKREENELFGAALLRTMAERFLSTDDQHLMRGDKVLPPAMMIMTDDGYRLYGIEALFKDGVPAEKRNAEITKFLREQKAFGYILQTNVFINVTTDNALAEKFASEADSLENHPDSKDGILVRGETNDGSVLYATLVIREMDTRTINLGPIAITVVTPPGAYTIDVENSPPAHRFNRFTDDASKASIIESGLGDAGFLLPMVN